MTSIWEELSSAAGAAGKYAGTLINPVIGDVTGAAVPVVAKGVGQLGNYVVKHPWQTAAVVGVSAALAVGAVFTGGADLAVAPEAEAAAVGLDVSVPIAAGEVGGAAAAAGAETSAGAAAITTDSAAAVATDAAAAEGDAGAAASESGPSVLSRIGGALRPIGGGILKGTASLARFGTMALGGGFIVGESLSMVSKGISDVTSSLGVSTSIPYSTPGGIIGLPTGFFGGGSGSGTTLVNESGSGAAGGQKSTLASFFGLTPAEEAIGLLLIVGGGLYLLARRHT